MSKVCIIVAISENGVIGNNGQLPWDFPEDLQRFKQLTEGDVVIMGRKTWESLPRKPLPNRQNIVVSASGNVEGEGAWIAKNLDTALIAAKELAKEHIWIIGGRRLYLESHCHADEMYITRVQGHFEGDALLDLKPCGQIWDLESIEPVVTQSPRNPGLRAYYEKWVLR